MHRYRMKLLQIHSNVFSVYVITCMNVFWTVTKKKWRIYRSIVGYVWPSFRLWLCVSDIISVNRKTKFWSNCSMYNCIYMNIYVFIFLFFFIKTNLRAHIDFENRKYVVNITCSNAGQITWHRLRTYVYVFG